METIKKMEPVVNYHLVRRAYPGKSGKYGYGPSVVSRGDISFEELCRAISEHSTLCDSDVVQVVQALCTNACLRLMNSEAFTLGPMGYLCSEIKSDLVTDPNDFRPSMIRSAHCVFKPSSELRKMVDNTTYKMVEVLPSMRDGIKKEQL